MLHVRILTKWPGKAVLTLACDSMILVVTVLARATVQTLNVITVARLYLAVGSLVALLAFAVGVRVRRITWHAVAMLTIGEAGTLLNVAILSRVVVDADA